MTKPANTTDRRVQRTRKVLHEAFVDLILEKRYDKITVQDIIDRANVGRSTFYAHFVDKEDLLLHGLHHYGIEFNEHKQAAQTSPPAEHLDGTDHVVHSLAFFQHAYENRSLYRAMVDGGGADFILNTAREHITADIETHLDARMAGSNPSAISLPVATSFLAGALMSVLAWWLDNGMPIPPHEVNQMYLALATPSLSAL